jgi:cysteine/O-acetylserine efflux protein
MTNLTPFLIYAFVTTFTPGPNNILSMSNGLRFGYKKTLPFLLGIAGGFFVLMLLCGVFNLTLATYVPSLRKWLNILGALYMLYLAYHILRSKPVEEGVEEKSLNTFRAGFILQFLNMKAILYGITVYSLFIIATWRDPLSISLFALGLALLSFTSISCWALGGNLFRNFLSKHYKIFNLVMAGLLIYSAIASLLEI